MYDVIREFVLAIYLVPKKSHMNSKCDQRIAMNRSIAVVEHLWELL